MGESVNWRIGEFLIVLLLAFSMPAFAKEVPVKEEKKEVDCLMCHGYGTLARFDKGGIVKSLYMDKEAFLKTGHGKAECAECHEGFEELPHKKDLPKVDCVRECHIVENGIEKSFSHKEMADLLAKSAHSRVKENGEAKENAELIPDCKGCHKFNFQHKKDIPEDQKLHHVMSKKDVVQVCSGCHADKAVQEKFNLPDVVSSYYETFHGKMQRYGREDAPDCIDCHADHEKGVHLILSKKVSGSSVDRENRHKTCSVKDCHKNAGPKLAGFHVHVSYDKGEYPAEHYVRLFFRILLTSIIYFLMTVVFLELLRRFSPNFGIIKKKGEKEGKS